MTERAMSRRTAHLIGVATRPGALSSVRRWLNTGPAAPALQAKVDLPAANSPQRLHVELVLALEDALAQ